MPAQRPSSQTTTLTPVQKADSGHRQCRTHAMRQANTRANHAACASCVHTADSVASSAKCPPFKCKVSSQRYNCQTSAMLARQLAAPRAATAAASRAASRAPMQQQLARSGVMPTLCQPVSRGLQRRSASFDHGGCSNCRAQRGLGKNGRELAGRGRHPGSRMRADAPEAAALLGNSIALDRLRLWRVDDSDGQVVN